MQVRDRLHDRQAQPAAGGAAAGDAIEAVEHARALGRRDPGPVVVDREHERGRVATHIDVDAPALARVPDRVLQEVAQQDPQRVGVARDRRLVGVRESEVDAARLRLRQRELDRLARDIGERDRLRRGARGGARLMACEHEQLLDETRGALDTRGQSRDRDLAGGVVARAPQALDLQRQRGEWRTQLVRGVGYTVPKEAA